MEKVFKTIKRIIVVIAGTFIVSLTTFVIIVLFFLPYGVFAGGLCVLGGASAGAAAPAAAV